MAEAEVFVLRGARLANWGGNEAADDGVVDVAVAHGRIAAIAPRLDDREIPSQAQVIDLDGRWLLPGLVDRHVHFSLWARQRSRLSVAEAASAAEAADIVSRALATLPQPPEVFIARGFQDALWPDAPTAGLLDDAAERAGKAGLPIVVISHDLHCVWISSAAAHRYGAAAGGLIREEQGFVIQQAVDAESAPFAAGLVADAVRAAAARGVTEIVDFHMEDNLAAWRHRIAAGVSSLRVRAALYPEHLPAALARGDRTGDVVPGTRGLLTVGPLKVFADGSLNTRTALCAQPYPGAAEVAGGYGFAALDDEELRSLLTRASKAGLGIALHAIGDLAVRRALDAFEATGATGSIEHAQLVLPEDLPRFARLGIAASVQPVHALDDRDVADAVWPDRADRAFPYGALVAAGARLLMGSDAPVAPLDPWLAIAAAVARTGDEREPWQPQNGLSIAQALTASVAYQAVEVGRHGDLVAVDVDPLTADAATLRAMPVSLTVCAGRITHEAF